MQKSKNTSIATNLTNNNSSKTPLVINLFGGPGCGKSTQAAYIFSKLKMQGINCELVTEFAKDKTWEHNSKALNCQPYVFGKQCYRMDRCKDEVDVIITDSPLFLSVLYNNDKEIEPEFSQLVLKKFNEFNNINFFLTRRKEYSPKGRNQTKEEAEDLDARILSTLNNFEIPYSTIKGSIKNCKKIISKVIK